MKNKIIITALIGVIVLMWVKNLSIKKESRQNRQELKKHNNENNFNRVKFI